MIRNGIDRVTDAPYRSLLEHLRLGLVSNMSGISPRHGWRSTVDVLPKLFTVSCLFAPEHGHKPRTRHYGVGFEKFNRRIGIHLR